MGAGGAITPGENGFGPPGSIRGAFSVGSAGGACVVDDGVVVVVVVVEVSDGASVFSPHAVNALIEMMAAIPSEAATRRVNRPVFMM